jgi:TP901 family phage tail tape measure protein
MEESGVKLIAQGASAFDADLKSATKAVDGFGREAQKSAGLVQDAAGRWRTASGRFASDAEKAAAGVATVAPAAKKAGDAAEKAGQDAEKGGRGFHAFGEIVTGALREIGVIAVQAFGQALRAGADFIGDSVKLAGDFDQTMSVLRATSNATAEDMGLVSAKAKSLGADLTLPATSAVDAGKAMLELSKAGFTVVEAMDAAKGVLQLAAAAQITEARAAEINANAINAFNLEAKDSIFVSDLLAASANASSIDATDMADTYKMAAAVFSNFQGPVVGAKQSIIDLTTAAAMLGNAGIKGSDAGTALKQSLLQLTAPSDKAKGLMRDLAADIGVTGDIAYDAQGKMRSFPEILGLVSASTKTLSDEQRNYIISTIFGADATRAILVLMEQGPDAWNAMSTAVTEQGAAQKLAAAQTEGFKGALEGAKSQVETLQLTIGQALTPILAELLNTYISPGVAALTNFAEALLGNDEAFAKLSPTMQEIVRGIGVLIDDVQNIVGAFDDAGAMSSEFGEAIGGLASDLGLPGELIQDVVFAVQGLVKWFGTASDESSNLGGAVDDLSGIWAKAQDVIENVMDAYMAIAKAVLPIVTAFVDEHGDEIEASFKTTWASIVEIVNLALDTYNAIVPPVLNAIAGFISEHGSEIGKILKGAWDMITSIITGTLDTIKGVFKVALALLSGDWAGAWNGIKGIVDTQVKAIGGAVGGFLDMIAGLFDTTLGDILQMWEDNWNMALDIVTSIDWGEVGANVVSGIISGVRGAAGGLMSTLRNLASDALQAAKDALGISSPSTAFMPVGEFAVQGIMEGFSNTWPALTGLIGSISADLIGDMENIGRDMQQAIADGFGSTASIDRQIAKNLDKFKDVLPQYEQFTSGALREAQSQAEAFLDPAEGARFFKMRSDQILEYAKLQKDLAKAETDDDRARIEAQMLLINRAQTAEISQFEAQQAGTQSATEKMADDINAIMATIAGINLTDDQIQIVGLLSSIWGTLQTPLPTRTDAYANPPMMQYPGGGSSTSTNTQNINMPIYTNNTPAALQQSWAVMQASMT